jgi:hypothetical protein
MKAGKRLALYTDLGVGTLQVVSALILITAIAPTLIGF